LNTTLRSRITPASEPRSSDREHRGPHGYLDLPLGVHPHSYDIWRERGAFVLDASGGAPPDAVFTGGQDWGFPPLHPEAIRQQRYRYYIATLRHQLRHTDLLRIDHVMGLHRLYWIPNGLAPRDGVYVRYPSNELYAILSLESHRHRTPIVGENLGTVPTYVNSTMARHSLHRMYVAQYELVGSVRKTLRAVPRDAVASLNTHDIAPFAAFWEGLDIDDRLDLGLLNPVGARIERKNRRALKNVLESFLQRLGWLKPSQGLLEIFECEPGLGRAGQFRGSLARERAAERPGYPAAAPELAKEGASQLRGIFPNA
jgi:4-alpha-glucanotransferase